MARCVPTVCDIYKNSYTNRTSALIDTFVKFPTILFGLRQFMEGKGGVNLSIHSNQQRIFMLRKRRGTGCEVIAEGGYP